MQARTSLPRSALWTVADQLADEFFGLGVGAARRRWPGFSAGLCRWAARRRTPGHTLQHHYRSA
jgi:hypothetical protein